MDDVDEASARLSGLHTTLCYLCSVNAHADVVASFLFAHPEALLFEGTAALPEDAALKIVEKQLMKTPKGHAQFENTIQVRDMIQKGFKFFKERQNFEATFHQEAFQKSLTLLIQWEYSVCHWRNLERRMRQRILEDAITSSHAYLRQDRGCFSCVSQTQRQKTSYDADAIRVAEYEQVLKEIRHGRRKQFRILKKAFSNLSRENNE